MISTLLRVILPKFEYHKSIKQLAKWEFGISEHELVIQDKMPELLKTTLR